MFEAIWVGTKGRTEEVFVGMKKGVAKSRTTKRLPELERWDAKLFHDMGGTTWQPLPGRQGENAPVEIGDAGKKA